MQTSLQTHTPSSRKNGAAPLSSPMLSSPMPIPEMVKKQRPFTSDLDSLLRTEAKIDPGIATEGMFEPDAPHGIFLGLRVAILFNAGLGLAGLMGYEVWAMLSH